MVVVAAAAPEQAGRDAWLEAELVIAFARVSAERDHDGKRVEDGHQRGETASELNFGERVGEDLGVGADAEVCGLGAAELEVASEAQVKDRGIPERSPVPDA